MGMPPSRKVHEKESCRNIIKNPVADEINTDTFIGWPMMTQIGGFSCGSQLYDIDPKREKYFINYDNVHPNALGQEFISELLFEKVEEIDNGSDSQDINNNINNRIKKNFILLIK